MKQQHKKNPTQKLSGAEDVRNRVISLLYGYEFYLSGSEDNQKARAYLKDLLQRLTDLQFTERQALSHWQKILKNYNEIIHQSKRNTDLRVAILDYFLNNKPRYKNPVFIEMSSLLEKEHKAAIDSLTGLFNRRYLAQIAEKEINRNYRHRSCLSQVMIDLDNFKILNDTHGHVTGDRVLSEFAEALKSTARTEDTVARYGGEEFCILLPETAETGAGAFTSRLREEIEKHSVLREYGVTFSAGISTTYGEKIIFHDLTEQADSALYRAKKAGKNCTVLFTDNEKRRYERYDHTWPVYCYSIDRMLNGEALPAITDDISLGGMKFHSSEPLKVSEKVIISIQPEESQALKLIGNVRWANRNKGAHSYGIEFYDINRKQLKELQSVIG